jgi:hypothetical protein
MQNFANGVKANPLHPLHNNQVIELLLANIADKDDKPNNLKIRVKDNKVYNQNQLIYCFSAIKEYLNNNAGIEGVPRYDDFIKLSILQSGTTNSPISFTSLIPYEDFKKLYATTISKLPFSSDVNMFEQLDVFQRNNWNNTEIVPKKRARWNDFSLHEILRYNSEEFRVISKAITEGEIPELIAISIFAQDSNFDIISYSWLKNLELLTNEEMIVNTKFQERIKIIKEKKKQMKAKGDYSFIHKGLFKKLYTPWGNFLLYKKLHCAEGSL